MYKKKQVEKQFVSAGTPVGCALSLSPHINSRLTCLIKIPAPFCLAVLVHSKYKLIFIMKKRKKYIYDIGVSNIFIVYFQRNIL